MSTSVVLLCAGRSKKIQSFGNRSLLKIGKNTLIEKQIECIRANIKNPDIVVVLGYEAERLYSFLKPLKVRCVLNEHYEDTSAIKSTILGLRATVGSEVYIIHGDIVIKKNIFVPTKSGCKTFYTTNKINDVGLLLDGRQVSRFAFGVNNTWNKVLYLNKSGVDTIKDLVISIDNERLLDFEIYNSLIERGLEIEAYKSNMVEINTIRDIKCV